MIWLLRHCEATGQDPDDPLTDKGMRQAETIVPTLAKLGVSRVVTSPYMRARASVAPFAKTGVPLEEDSHLAEWRLSHTPHDDWQEILKASFADPAFALDGGETTATAMTRSLQSIHAHSADGSLFVTHGGLMTLILSRFGRDLSLDALLDLGTPDLFALDGSTCQRIELPEIT